MGNNSWVCHGGCAFQKVNHMAVSPPHRLLTHGGFFAFPRPSAVSVAHHVSSTTSGWAALDACASLSFPPDLVSL